MSIDETLKKFQVIFDELFPDLHLEARASRQNATIVVTYIIFESSAFFDEKELNRDIIRTRITKTLWEMRDELDEKIKEIENEGRV